jgi:hypothetical protein
MSETLDQNSYLLGKDAKIQINNDIIELAVNSDGDIDVTSYTENIVSALNRRLHSNFQELVLHLEYGGFLSVYVSELMDFEMPGVLKILLEKELLKDPRVVSVDSLGLYLEKDYRRLVITYSITLINQQVLNNNVYANIGE